MKCGEMKSMKRNENNISMKMKIMKYQRREAWRPASMKESWRNHGV
jgi:hypothetical protein